MRVPDSGSARGRLTARCSRQRIPQRTRLLYGSARGVRRTRCDERFWCWPSSDCRSLVTPVVVGATVVRVWARTATDCLRAVKAQVESFK